MKNINIFKSNNCYSSFPSIARINSKHLMITFRVAGEKSVNAALNNLTTHHSLDSKIATIESFDNGLTWSDETLKFIFNEKDVSVNDPAITVLKNGDIYIRFTKIRTLTTGNVKNKQENIISFREEHSQLSSALGNYFIVSKDIGKSWSDPVFMDLGEQKFSFSREPIIELADGSMIFSFYRGAPERTDESFIAHSFDSGYTWQKPYKLFSDPSGSYSEYSGINFNETAVLALGKGSIIAIARGDENFTDENNGFMQVGGFGYLYLSYSNNGGISWYPHKKTNMWGQPAHLIHLNDGRILCTYGYRKKPYGVRASISNDHGKTWQDEVVIRNDGKGWDLGYTSSVQLNDKEILTVYYFFDEDKIRHISGTIWKVS